MWNPISLDRIVFSYDFFNAILYTIDFLQFEWKLFMIEFFIDRIRKSVEVR